MKRMAVAAFTCEEQRRHQQEGWEYGKPSASFSKSTVTSTMPGEVTDVVITPAPHLHLQLCRSPWDMVHNTKERNAVL